ncbi:succinate dehydrogenase assembly factor 2 [Mortierella sp. GBA43]|nr:succinate dehydrogenase assembly factor 2 [Mortierella sp. GBA43]
MTPSAIILRNTVRVAARSLRTTGFLPRPTVYPVATAFRSSVWSSYSTKTTGSEQSGRVQDHDDARDVDPDVFNTPYTNLPPLPRDPNESLETIRARLTYQSRKRGILETDLILSTFAKDFLNTMTLEECRTFDKIMDEPDWDIYYWVTGKKDVPEKWRDNEVFLRIVQHAKNEGRVVRQMPSL